MNRNDLDRHITGNYGEDQFDSHAETCAEYGPELYDALSAILVEVDTFYADDFGDYGLRRKFDDARELLAKIATSS